MMGTDTVREVCNVVKTTGTSANAVKSRLLAKPRFSAVLTKSVSWLSVSEPVRVMLKVLLPADSLTDVDAGEIVYDSRSRASSGSAPYAAARTRILECRILRKFLFLADFTRFPTEIFEGL